MTAPIVIENYDRRWPLQFETLRARIASQLGSMALAIEHIGSTAVPGLAAKPIIDIDVLLRSRAELTPVIDALATLGYGHEGNLGVPGREVFRAPAGDFAHHLYVCLPESGEYLRHLAFRNHLRSHPDDASKYANLKRKLSVQFANDREAYTRGKNEFVEAILRRSDQ